MKAAIVAALMLLCLPVPARAGDVVIPFRNPILSSADVDHAALGAMVASQTWDAINSGRRHRDGWREDNVQYRAFARAGVVGYIVGFAAWDLLELAIARRLRIRARVVESYQAEQSLTGIIKTNSGHGW